MRRADNILIRLLALEVARTAESMALVAHEAASRRLSQGHLSRAIKTLRKDMLHLAPTIRSLIDHEEERRRAATSPDP